MTKSKDPDYLNEQYFEDWGADPSVTEKSIGPKPEFEEDDDD